MNFIRLIALQNEFSVAQCVMPRTSAQFAFPFINLEMLNYFVMLIMIPCFPV